MSVARIEAALRGSSGKKPALVVYLTVGDPSVEDSRRCALAALEAGADVLELGVPFSDPTADGPVIAAASYRAIHQRRLAARGARRRASRSAQTQRAAARALHLLQPDRRVRRRAAAVEPPRDAGVDGFLVVDLPPEEGADAAQRAAEQARARHDPARRADHRPRARAARARAGERLRLLRLGHRGHRARRRRSREAAATRPALRERAGLPVVVGFGIARQKTRAP